MLTVAGIGWISAAGRGRVRTGWSEAWGSPESRAAALAREPDARVLRNYARFTPHTRMAVHALHLARTDADLAATPDYGPFGAGLVGAGELGTHAANLAYYRDFVGNARALARGNLFVYTLPTSPLAEAALAAELRGPLLWLDGSADGDGLADAFAAADDAIARGAASTMFVCHGQAEAVILYTVRRDGAGGWPASAVLAAARGAQEAGMYPDRWSIGQGAAE